MRTVARPVLTQRCVSCGDLPVDPLLGFSETRVPPCQTGYFRMVPDLKAGRVLIYRIGSLGDTIVALPCFHLIQRKYPNAERVLLTNSPIHAKAPAADAILANTGLIHGY